MEIGYAQQSITPALDRPVFLAGFGQNRRAQSVHDDLYARALALRDGPHTLALCALDLLGLVRADVLEIARQVNAEAPGTQVLIASTHTHHAPDTLGLWGPDDKTCGIDPAYLKAVKEKTAGVILASLENMQPARMKCTSLPVPGLAKNARDPEILDIELTLVQFIHPESWRPLVTLVDFPCHPEVLGSQNPHITADYAGVLRRAVEAASGAACIFFAGALGGMMTPDVQDHSFAEAEAMGEKLAAEGLQALAETDRHVGGGFKIQSSPIQVKLTNPLFKLAIRRKLIPELRGRRGVILSQVSLLKIDGLWLGAITRKPCRSPKPSARP
jgi:hypothetical protein